MNSVWIVFDMERYDTRDSEEAHIAGVFATQEAALETRKRLEQRNHPDAGMGYTYHFEIVEHDVHESELTEEDIARGCASVLSPPLVKA